MDLNPEEFFLIDLTGTVSDHLEDIFASELLGEVGHHVAQLGCQDETFTVLIKDMEGLQISSSLSAGPAYKVRKRSFQFIIK